MKKSLLLAAAVAIAMSSCSKNDVTELATPNDNPNAIGLNIGTFVTKSTATTTSTMETKAAVSVYSDDASVRELEFTYSDGKWSQSTYKWSQVDFTSGFKVYSMFDGTNVDLSASDHEFTVDNDVASQKDLVYFSKTLTAIPSGNAINAVYNHALSRIKMTNSTDATATTVGLATTSAVKFNGFDMDGTITLDASDGSMDWDLITAIATPASASATVYNLAAASTETNDMYILPQSGTAFTYDAATAAPKPTPTTNVEVLCYTETSANERLAGWESVADFIAANPGTTVKKGTTDYSGAMYVKVLFPVQNSVIFAAATYYNLNLNFAGSIYYAESGKYYDIDGNPLTVTGSVITTQPVVGEPVNPDADAYIGLTVEVIDWPSVGTPGVDL